MNRALLTRTSPFQRVLGGPGRSQQTSTTFHTSSHRLLPSPASKEPLRPASETPQSSSIPSASFKDLGATKTVKIVVIVFLSICGTLETIGWYKFLMAKYYGSGAEDGKEEEDQDWKDGRRDGVLIFPVFELFGEEGLY